MPLSRTQYVPAYSVRSFSAESIYRSRAGSRQTVVWLPLWNMVLLACRQSNFFAVTSERVFTLDNDEVFIEIMHVLF
jgi:hypothetical protein